MAARKPRSRDVSVVVTMRVHRGMTVAEAKRELKTRANDLCGHYEWLRSGRLAEESDLKIRKISKWPKS